MTAAILILALGACASKPKPAPAQVFVPVVIQPPAPALLPAPTPAPALLNWRDVPITAGDWHWSREGSQSVARFTGNTAGTRLSLSCDGAAHTITLRWQMGRWQAGASGPMPLTITATSLHRVLSAAPTSETPPSIAVTLAASDPLLDAISFSRGRFMVEAPGLAPLYLPNWPEISRVIEDCR